MNSSLSEALFREIPQAFFRVLSGQAAKLYVDAIDALERAASLEVKGITRDDAIAIIEDAVDLHADIALDEESPALLSTREKARAVFEVLRRAGWLEEEERSDWRRVVYVHSHGITLLQTLRKLAFPEAVVFSDNLVSVCSTLTRRDPTNDPFREEPWQHIESCMSLLNEGIAELRGMHTAIERHTRQQLRTATLKENLAVLFDQFAERIGHACYAELVHARLPLRLGEARRRVEEMDFDTEMLAKMQAELMRRDPALSAETAMSRVRLRLDELADLLQSVVPVADAVDRRTAEFTRRSLARFRYLQETTSENRSRVQTFFEILNSSFAGRRVADLDEPGIEFPKLLLHEARLFAGVESLYTPRLRRAADEIPPLDDEASGDEQDHAIRRLNAAMRDSLTVARANRFVEELIPERGDRISSNDIPIRCEEDLADVIACLLHAHASDSQYRLEVEHDATDAETPVYDSKLSYRIERFSLTRK